VTPTKAIDPELAEQAGAQVVDVVGQLLGARAESMSSPAAFT